MDSATKKPPGYRLGVGESSTAASRSTPGYAGRSRAETAGDAQFGRTVRKMACRVGKV